MRKILHIILYFTLTGYSLKAQEKADQYYTSSLIELSEMLEGNREQNFKRAVFVVENAFFEGGIDFDKYCKKIGDLKWLCEEYINANRNNFLYDGEDKEKIIVNAAIFKIITEKIPILLSTTDTVYHLPYTYDFTDIWGREDWSKMFVAKLLDTHTGNCHSLPFLYKILAEELGITAHLALAPNHIYIKHRSEKLGMYNSELTSATFPVDAWLMASGYIHLDAIKSGIYMDTLSLQQSIALCIVDLAKGYERKFGTGNGEFILLSCNMALKYYPNCINAMLLKAEILKNKFDAIKEQHGAKHPGEIFHVKEAKGLFTEYELLIGHIHQLGYRKMPEKMYLEWLVSLKKEEEKYVNKKIISNFHIK